MNKWQPIETAPKDGESVLVFSSYGILICCWSWSNKWDDGEGRGEDATHWMPLPDPPYERWAKR